MVNCDGMINSTRNYGGKQNNMGKIKVTIIGIGNCASSLIQGIHYYHRKTPDEAIGIMHWDIGGYKPFDIEVVVAFDVDKRKIGLDVNKAIFSKPNCTTVFCADIPQSEVKVQMGKILDGFSDHMKNYPEDNTFNIPVFIASDPGWAKRFADKNLPIIGDDIKAQLGATITHRILTDDSIRCVKLALDRKQGGILTAPAAYFCKHPPKQFTDDEAYTMTNAFIQGK